MFQEGQVGPGLQGIFQGLLQGAAGEGGAVADQGAGKDGFVPTVLQLYLGSGEVEPAMQPGQNGLETAALGFERSATG